MKNKTRIWILSILTIFLVVGFGLFFFSSEKKEIKFERKEEVRKDFVIEKKIVDWGFVVKDERKIDAIIIHTSFNNLGGDQYDLEKLLQEYKKYDVSPHYLIDRKGVIYQLVEEKDVAHHAGKSEMPDKRTNVNDFSIGIELMNSRTDILLQKQYEALNWLIQDIKSRHKIDSILGHNQISPSRKNDPWNFDWGEVKK